MEFMSTNICSFKNSLVICGSCLPETDPDAFNKLKIVSESIYFVCLETVHMNMLAHKVAAVIEQGNVNKIIFASVDKSPHCIQLHYIKRELKKMFHHCELKSFIANHGELIEVSDETIALSKNLFKLTDS